MAIAFGLLGLVGEVIINRGIWREIHEADQERLSDLSGRTRFGWGKKKYKMVEHPDGAPLAPRLPCVLPPRR